MAPAGLAPGHEARGSCPFAFPRLLLDRKNAIREVLVDVMAYHNRHIWPNAMRR